MTTRAEYYKLLIYQCANALSPEAIERILREPLAQEPEDFDVYLRTFVEGQLTKEQMTLAPKKIPRQPTLDKILRTWEVLQQTLRRDTMVEQLATDLLAAPAGSELSLLLTAFDPAESRYGDCNFTQPGRIVSFSQCLRQALSLSREPTKSQALDSLLNGCTRGVQGCSEVDQAIRDWVFDAPQSNRISFSLLESPWQNWGQRFSHTPLRQLFEAIAAGRLDEFLGQHYRSLDSSLWVEWVLVLRFTEFTLLELFEQRLPAGIQATRLAINTHLTFISLWSQLSEYLRQQESALLLAAYKVSLQVLKSFARKPYFPLYGPMLVNLSGAAVGEVLTYLREPLRQSDGSPELAKVYNLLGYVFTYQGTLAEALTYFDRGIEIAQTYGDTATEMACTINRSWALTEQNRPREAVSSLERALVVVRTIGHRLGEAYALAGLGHAYTAIYRYPEALEYFSRAMALARDRSETPCEVLCLLGIGSVYQATERYAEAADILAEAVNLSRRLQDLSTLAQALLIRAEAYNTLGNPGLAIREAVTALLIFDRLHSPRTRRVAGLLTILRGQLGAEHFEELLLGAVQTLEQTAISANLERVKQVMSEFGQS